MDEEYRPEESRYGGFDYDKSEKLIAIGRKKTQQALEQQYCCYM